jgi:hypothetical protein
MKCVVMLEDCMGLVVRGSGARSDGRVAGGVDGTGEVSIYPLIVRTFKSVFLPPVRTFSARAL